MKLLSFALGGGQWCVLGEACIVTLVPPGGPEMYEGLGVALESLEKGAGPKLARRALDSFTEPTICTAAELPGELVSSPGWPDVHPSFAANLLPRSSFRIVRISLLRGIMGVLEHRFGKLAPGTTIPIAGIPFWKNGAARTFLAAAGYPVAP